MPVVLTFMWHNFVAPSVLHIYASSFPMFMYVVRVNLKSFPMKNSFRIRTFALMTIDIFLPILCMLCGSYCLRCKLKCRTFFTNREYPFICNDFASEINIKEWYRQIFDYSVDICHEHSVLLWFLHTDLWTSDRIQAHKPNVNNL